MVEWVWRAAAESGLMDPVVVATDPRKWRKSAAQRGIPGGDDVAALRQRIGSRARGGQQIDAEIYVNIQGDEPTLTPDFFPPLLALFDRAEVQVATLAVRCPAHDIGNPNAVKVVTAQDGRALYFSRATIPFDRDGQGLPATASIWGSMRTGRRRWSVSRA